MHLSRSPLWILFALCLSGCGSQLSFQDETGADPLPGIYRAQPDTVFPEALELDPDMGTVRELAYPEGLGLDPKQWFQTAPQGEYTLEEGSWKSKVETQGLDQSGWTPKLALTREIEGAVFFAEGKKLALGALRKTDGSSDPAGTYEARVDLRDKYTKPGEVGGSWNNLSQTLKLESDGSWTLETMRIGDGSSGKTETTSGKVDPKSKLIRIRDGDQFFLVWKTTRILELASP